MKTNSPGKINLFLDVTAKRENGYHEILTLFLPIHDLSDTIEIIDSDELKITSDHSAVPQDETNLCHQAASLFAEKSGITPNWQIDIEKKLPVAGGMGGGSSNAAITLKLLNEKYNQRLTHNELAEIALSIGADVPYFLNPVPSFAKGVGEEIESLEALHKIPLLLITFDFPISAAWSYQNRLKDFHSSEISVDRLKSLWQASELKLADIIYNDLAFAPRQKFPILQQAIDDLQNTDGVAEVSGSGPTVFAAFNTILERDSAFEKLLKLDYPEKNIYKATAG